MPSTLTLITLTYNAARVLPGLIASLRLQTDREFEWVVVDGASTDGTLEILAAAPDVVTKCVSEPDFGIYDALNKAVKIASGDYYLVLGADDRLTPEAIAHYRRAARDTKADLITAAVNREGVLLRPGKKFTWAKGIWSLISNHSVGCLIRRTLHERVGDYSKHYPIAADMEFLLNAYQHGATIAAIEEVVGSFGTQGISTTDLLGNSTESFRIRVAGGNRLLPEMVLLCAKLWVGRSVRKGYVRRGL